MSNRHFAIVGFLAPTFFWVTYFIIASLRPEYSFLYKAVSELGSMDAPNKWVWNTFGYLLPGLFIALFSLGLRRAFGKPNSSRFPFITMSLSGILMALAGIFPGDFDNRQSVTMLLHSIGSFGSYVFFLLSAFTIPKQMQKKAYWATAVKPTLAFTWMTILFGSWPFVFPQFPAVGQRFVFFFYFLWVITLAYKLYYYSSANGK